MIPDQVTKIPHGTDHLSPCSTARESVLHHERSHVPQLRPDTAASINKCLFKKERENRVIKKEADLLFKLTVLVW